LLAYRVIVRNVFQQAVNSDFLHSKAVLITATTAAFINILFTLVMNQIHGRLALRLAHLECPKTASQFDTIYKLKVFLFRCINFCSSLFYIAFLKGRFQDPDGKRSNGVKTYTQDDCGPLGCMVDLAIQLVVIMLGQQVFGQFMDIGYP
jgi:Calcium-activated chloride channel